MDIRQYLDSTYLKTAQQAGITEDANREVALSLVREAIDQQFKLAMIRPEYVAEARKVVDDAGSTLAIGTVIGFPEGTMTIAEKLEQARQAIDDGADELDFVCNYRAFLAGDEDLVRQEIFEGTELGLHHLKVVKWIIEVAAMDLGEVARISSLIKSVVVSHFEGHYNEVFVKSSTGFYKTDDGAPNGATVETVVTMLENAAPLPVKAAGGVRNFDEAAQMIALGVKRIGTSAAKIIADGGASQNIY